MASVFDDIMSYFEDTVIKVEIGGDTYNCNRVNPMNGEVLYSDAGTVNGVEFSLIFKVKDFDAIPLQDSLITVDSTIFRIGKVIVDSQNITFKTLIVRKYN